VTIVSSSKYPSEEKIVSTDFRAPKKKRLRR